MLWICLNKYDSDDSKSSVNFMSQVKMIKIMKWQNVDFKSIKYIQ